MRAMGAAYCILLSPRSFATSGPDLYRRRDVQLGKLVLDAFVAAGDGRVESCHEPMVEFTRDVYAVASRL